MKTAEDAEAKENLKVSHLEAPEGSPARRKNSLISLCVLSGRGFAVSKFYFVIIPHAMRSPEFPEGSVL